MEENNSNGEQPVTENILLQQFGIQGLIVMVIVVALIWFIFLMSKLNEWAKHKLPMLWQSRILAEMKKVEEEYNKISTMENNIIKKHELINICIRVIAYQKGLVGGSEQLAKIASMNIDVMERNLLEWKSKTELEYQSLDRKMKRNIDLLESYELKAKLKQHEKEELALKQKNPSMQNVLLQTPASLVVSRK
jgi:hypothetical protein